jgi:hypothetical protein
MNEKEVTKRMKWKVDKELQGSPGLAFIKDYLSGYDFSELEWITLKRGSWGFGPNNRWTNAVHGKCRRPTPGGLDLYRINCTINTRRPFPLEAYTTMRFNEGRRKVPSMLDSEDEAIVAIVAHEASHFLGFTGQIPGSGREHNGHRSTDEIEAGQFEKEAVRAFREHMNSATGKEIAVSEPEVLEVEIVEDDGYDPNDPSELANFINAGHREVQRFVHSTLLKARDVGQALAEAKQLIGHGDYTKWVEENCEFSVRTARDYLKVFNNWAQLQNGSSAADMSLRAALEQLKPPAKPVRTETKTKKRTVRDEEKVETTTLEDEDIDFTEYCARGLRIALEAIPLANPADVAALLSEGRSPEELEELGGALDRLTMVAQEVQFRR